MIKFLVPSGPNKAEEHVHEEMPLEKSVLHELELVMAQVSFIKIVEHLGSPCFQLC